MAVVVHPTTAGTSAAISRNANRNITTARRTIARTHGRRRPLMATAHHTYTRSYIENCIHCIRVDVYNIVYIYIYILQNAKDLQIVIRDWVAPRIYTLHLAA